MGATGSEEIDCRVFSRCRTLDDLLAVAEREGIDLWELEVMPVLMATIEGCEDEETQRKLFASWNEAGYGSPTVNKRFGVTTLDSATLTLSPVASLSSRLSGGGQAGDHAGGQVDGADLFETSSDFRAVSRGCGSL